MIEQMELIKIEESKSKQKLKALSQAVGYVALANVEENTIKTNTIYNEDCLETMTRMKDKSIDVIITDPPFFAPAIHYQSRISWGRCWGDMSTLGQAFFDWCKEWKRILKDDGHLFVFSNDESYPVFYPVAYGLWDFTTALVWNKKRVGLGKIFRHQFEMILWASNKGAYVNNDGKLHSDVLEYEATYSADRDHPVEKPTSLMRELIRVCAKPNAVIYDAFLGGGNTIIAAEMENRKWIGSEMKKEYCDVSRKKIENFRSQKSFVFADSIIEQVTI